MYNIKSSYHMNHEQAKAVKALVKGINNHVSDQVLLGVTGSGKTFTIANTIKEVNLPTLIISHNKTLAAQTYHEMKEFFPQNAVSYFVSYYDYYQPEAYIPQKDVYIEKEASINEYIDKLRLETTTNILSNDNVIIVASVSCIYNIGSPQMYKQSMHMFKKGDATSHKELIERLVKLQYEKVEFDFKRSTFRIRGNYIDIYSAYRDEGIRIEIKDNKISSICLLNPISGEKIDSSISTFPLFAAKLYMVDKKDFKKIKKIILKDLKIHRAYLIKKGMRFEAQRLQKRVCFDLEMIEELGYVNGIENYSRYFDGRKTGEPPHSLLDYFYYRFNNNWLCVLDESHMTVPQIRGMHNGDFSRKKNLVDYGFRLPSAFDNRPLKWGEFMSKTYSRIYLSATPSLWEMNKSKDNIVEQLVRPTGIVDPEIDIRPVKHQVMDLCKELKKVVEKKQRALVTTLTKKTSEDLTEHLVQNGFKTAYLHSDIKTLDRTDILRKLRQKEFDILVGINLLREGLDLPEVALVAVLDADVQGFLRNRTSLIQIMGRAARNTESKVILYADTYTDSIKEAVEEVIRRRKYQIAYNKKYNISPTSILKKISLESFGSITEKKKEGDVVHISNKDINKMTPYDKQITIKKLTKEINNAVKIYDFEKAIELRDIITMLTK